MSAIPVNIIYLLGIPPEDLADIQAAAATLRTKLLPHLRDLNAAERRALAKMGPASVDFCDKTYAHTCGNVQLKPGFVDVDVYGQTVDDHGTLGDIMRDIDTIHDQGHDSLMLLGSQQYVFSLACYNAFQQAAKMKLPGAEQIVADLAPRFAKATATLKAAQKKAAAKSEELDEKA